MVCRVLHVYCNRKRRRVDEEKVTFGMGVTILRDGLSCADGEIRWSVGSSRVVYCVGSGKEQKS